MLDQIPDASPADDLEETPPVEAADTSSGEEEGRIEFVGDGEQEPTDEEQPLEEGQEVAQEALEPVTVRAGGQSFTVPGAMLAPEGMYVPKANLDAVLSLIQRGRHHEMTWPAEQQRYKEETRRLEALRQVDLAEAVAWTTEMNRAFKDEDSCLAFIDNLATNLEMMKQRVASAKQTKELEVLRSGVRLDSTPNAPLQGEEFVAAASQSLLNYFDEIADDPEVTAMLPKADRDAVWEQIARQANLYVTKAPADDPQNGIAKGEMVIDLQRLHGDVKRVAQFLGRGRSSGQEGASKADRARQINKAAMNGAPRTPRPPAPTQRVAARATEQPQVDGYEGWRNRMLALASED